VVLEDDLGEVRLVAALDADHSWFRQKTTVRLFVFSYPQLRLVEASQATTWAPFPYQRGLLSFAEAPAALFALQKLRTMPDLLLADGHGIAHPRRFGLASHLGVLSGIPTIGMAQRLLVGDHEPVPDEAGAWRPIIEENEVVGAALRPRDGGRLVYVSPGHRVGLETAVSFVLSCTVPSRPAIRPAGKETALETLTCDPGPGSL
jgi:deoxyribonuclease V